MAIAPDFTHEASFWKKGASFVFGVDEAGRGCLAGPVTAAVAAWPAEYPLSALPAGLRDSKQVSEENREAIFAQLMDSAAATGLRFGVGFASAAEIDRFNILRATHLAVARAVAAAWKLSAPKLPQVAFIADGNRPLFSPSRHFWAQPEFRAEFAELSLACGGDAWTELPVVKGDTKVASVATASILAKVSRDRAMRALSEKHPGYNFSGHKGYGTPDHVRLLRELGPCPEHRRSFAPVREAFEAPTFF